MPNTIIAKEFMGFNQRKKSSNKAAAFMQGKLKLAGDLNLAMKMTQMFKIR